ncbi:MAG: V-type ATP synthase subunit E [Ruminococcus sp.]|nr:V-type ATP synthase subunit E [Ruminococcus sp.]
MNINETEKLERFRQAVFDEADRKARDITEAAELEYKNRLDEAQNNAAQSEQDAKKEADRAMQDRQLREVSAQRIGSQRNVLIHREELIERVFSNVRQKLADLRKTDKYKAYLKQKATLAWGEYPEFKGTAYLAPEDMKYADVFDGFEVKERDGIELGGVLIVYDEQGIALDNTFDSAFEEQRALFSNRSELAL